MPQSLSNFDAALKDNYGPGLRNGINNSSAFLSEVQPDTRRLRGRQAVWDLKSGRSNSSGNVAELGSLPDADRQRHTQLTQSLVYHYHTVKVSGQALHLSRGDEAAFVSAMEDALEGAEKDIKNEYHRQGFGQALTDGTDLQTGVLGVQDDGASGDPSGATTVTMVGNTESEMRHFFIGQKINFVNPSGGAQRAGGPYAITAISTSAKTLTVDSNINAAVADGDYVVMAVTSSTNAFGQEIAGLRHLISTQKYAGVDPSTVPAWGAVSVGSASTQISELLFVQADEKIVTDGNGEMEDRLFITAYSQRQKLASQLQAQKRYDGMVTKTKAGWAGLAVANGTLVADRYCPDDFGVALSMSEVVRFVGLDWTWDEDGEGRIFKALDGTDAVQARFKTYHNLAVLTRNAHCSMTMSVPSF